MPAPPASEFDNVEALETIHDHPDLFAITPINVDRFQSLLSSHPNQSFVQSLCQWPLTWDNSQGTPKNADEAAFLQEQIGGEVELGRYSRPFVPDLLPGIHVQYTHSCIAHAWQQEASACE